MPSAKYLRTGQQSLKSLLIAIAEVSLLILKREKYIKAEVTKNKNKTLLYVIK